MPIKRNDSEAYFDFERVKLPPPEPLKQRLGSRVTSTCRRQVPQVMSCSVLTQKPEKTTNPPPPIKQHSFVYCLGELGLRVGRCRSLIFSSSSFLPFSERFRVDLAMWFPSPGPGRWSACACACVCTRRGRQTRDGLLTGFVSFRRNSQSCRGASKPASVWAGGFWLSKPGIKHIHTAGLLGTYYIRVVVPGGQSISFCLS